MSAHRRSLPYARWKKGDMLCWDNIKDRSKSLTPCSSTPSNHFYPVIFNIDIQVLHQMVSVAHAKSNINFHFIVIKAPKIKKKERRRPQQINQSTWRNYLKILSRNQEKKRKNQRNEKETVFRCNSDENEQQQMTIWNQATEPTTWDDFSMFM